VFKSTCLTYAALIVVLLVTQDDHITSKPQPVYYCLLTDSSAEPLRRGDLLNAINKLAGDRAQTLKNPLLIRPAAIKRR
jgi:hypothetical protein